MKNIVIGFFVLATTFISSISFAQTITISKSNTQVFFQVTHPLGHTIGYFNNFSGSIELNEAQDQVIAATALLDTTSINTNNPVRDEGLKSNLFLDTVKFPQATYENGALILKGISKPVPLTVEKSATGKIILKGSFDRSQFGMNYNKPHGKIKKSIGNIVAITIEIHPG